VQCLVRDVAEVTRAQASAIMAEARATRVEKLAQERAVLLAAALGEMNEAAWRASALCHTPFRERGNEASIRVPRTFKSHAWQQYDKQMKYYE
jgi:hypothetical protein